MLLEINDLSVEYKTVYGRLKALNGIDLSIDKGESVSLVGESGSGKSTLGLSIVRLLPLNASYTSGSILLDGKDIVAMSDAEAKAIRGTVVFMIFQDPLNSLNPVKKVSTQMFEALNTKYKREGRGFDEKLAYQQAIESLKSVRMPDPELIIERYPHQLSGGQIQRVVIAMGLLMLPKLLIADEPTSALDITIQAQVLKLMSELKKEYGMSIMFITHDISVAYNISDRMEVMYAGEVDEDRSTDEVLKNPLHPYSKALISSIPRVTKREAKLKAIQGSPPDMLNPPQGCRFHPRCPAVMDVCRTNNPRYTKMNSGRVRCFLYG
jgi:peptide/nickel transport system ATP-binding protein